MLDDIFENVDTFFDTVGSTARLFSEKGRCLTALEHPGVFFMDIHGLSGGFEGAGRPLGLCGSGLGRFGLGRSDIGLSGLGLLGLGLFHRFVDRHRGGFGSGAC